MNKIRIFLLILVITLPAYAQQMGIWKNYTNMKSIVDAGITAEGVWAATSGGAFFYNFNDKSFLQLTKDKGLSSNSLTSMTIDNYGKIWFGSEDGAIDVYDPVKKEFVKRILELYNSDKTLRKVNNLRVQGDTVFAATDFGLSLIDSKTYFFLDTYLKFGSLPSDTKVRNSYTDGLLYVMTESGVAVQKQGATNLSAPESWNNLSTLNGLPSNLANEALNYKGTLLLGTDKGLTSKSGDAWVPVMPGFFNNVNITDLEIKGDTLLILAANSIFYYINGNIVKQTPLPVQGKKVLTNGEIFVGTSGSGICRIISQEAFESYAPAGPSSNFFPGIAVDKEGNLWSGSGSGTMSSGFYKYDGEQWTNYSMADVPGARFNTVYKVYTAPDNTVYLMSFGDGFYRFRDNKFQVFNASNTDLKGIPKDLNFVVIGGLSVDSKGNLWSLTYGSESRQALAVLKTDSSWQFITNMRNDILQGYDLVVDQYDTKWMVVSKEGASSGEAVHYYNEKPLTSADVNGWNIINTEDGLNSGTVNAIALDRRGELWIGTGAGINIIPDTKRPSRILTVYTLRSQVINCLAVDALNQKWVGTQQGAFLLSPDGTKLLANYTTSNSALPSDIIKSISIDHNTGTVYFGTDYGLTSVTTSAVNPVESFSELFVYPNPVVVSKGDPVLITIDGLIRDSEIKILNISGKLINAFSSPGGRIANWDGKDIEGENVPSGIYLIIAYDQEGSSVSTAKVAIVNK